MSATISFVQLIKSNSGKMNYESIIPISIYLSTFYYLEIFEELIFSTFITHNAFE